MQEYEYTNPFNNALCIFSERQMVVSPKNMGAEFTFEENETDRETNQSAGPILLQGENTLNLIKRKLVF